METDERRRRLARELGADKVLEAEAVREYTNGVGDDLVLDFVGSDQTPADGMAVLGRLGTYTIVGYGGTLSVPSEPMVAQEQAAVA